jgi:hypothetical protein
MAHKIGRNDPCPCGSGKKYKHCCLRRDEQRRAQPPQRTLESIRSMAETLVRHSPEQAAEAQQLLAAAEEAAAYESRRAEIDAACQSLEAHRGAFEALMADVEKTVKRAERLFAEEPFRPLRYTVADVHRAFQAVGYPVRFGRGGTENMEVMFAAQMHLAGGEKERGLLSMRLLLLLPQYVAAGRYLDAWLIQYSAFLLSEASDRSNPFLYAIFNLAYDEWARQVDTQQEAMFREMGLDRTAFAGRPLEEVAAALQTQFADPVQRARWEAFVESSPMVRDQAQAEVAEMERATLVLLEREDGQGFYLSPEEMQPWLPLLRERLRPLEARARQALAAGAQERADMAQAVGDVLVAVAQEMAPAVFTPERQQRLLADMREYRRRRDAAGEREAALYASTVVGQLEREEPPADIPFLLGICFASLREALAALSGPPAAEPGEVAADA